MQLLIDERKRSSLTTLYWKMGFRTLLTTQQPILDLAGNIPPEELKARVPLLLKDQQMHEYLVNLWVTTGSIFAIDTLDQIAKLKKSEETDLWEDYFRRYTNERSLVKAGEIVSGQTLVVNQLIDKIVAEGYEMGLGIDVIQRKMRSELLNGLTEINKYQAERIARTEVNGASNKGSFDAARDTGAVLSKEWITSGLPNIRENHLTYESWGEVEMDFEYADGLQYPCDPNGAPEEIINCRCGLIYNVD